jgi:hypothetical protein
VDVFLQQQRFSLTGTSKNACLVMRREILFQIEVQKTQESFVDFKFFCAKSWGKSAGTAPGRSFLR